MSKEVKKERLKGAGLYLLALIFITNPTVNIFDILPDFIGYLIIIKRLSYGIGRVPYFEETKKSLLTLSLISVLKIPSFFIMNYATAKNVSDQDIRSLFSFTFAVAETVFMFALISNLFAALFYLGERSNAESLIGDFRIGKSKTRVFSTEKLRTFAYAFAVFKNAAYSLPELLLLKRGVDSGDYYNTFNFARLYPYAVVILIPLVAVAQIFLIRRFYSYIKAIMREGKFKESIDGMLDENAKINAEKNDILRRMTAMLSLFTLASVFTLEVRFDNFASANLLPHAIYATILTVALCKLMRYTKKSVPALVVGISYLLMTVVAYVFEIIFLDTYGYQNLTNAAARESYLTVVILFIAEFILLAGLVIFITLLLSKYVVMHTGLQKTSENYMRSDAIYHKGMKGKVCIWAAISILAGLSKLLESIFRYFSKKTPIAGDPIFGTVTGGLLPWFGVVVTFFSVLAICYSFYLFGILKDDTALRYSESYLSKTEINS